MDNENSEMIKAILDTMHIDKNTNEYYTLEQNTLTRHNIAISVIEQLEKALTELAGGVKIGDNEIVIECHEKGYDPLSYLLSSAYSKSESTSGKNFNPIFAVINTMIKPEYEYFKYYLDGKDNYPFWRRNPNKKTKHANAKGEAIFQRDSYIHMVADEDSKNYMGAVITHNTEHSKKPKHLIEVYYSTVFWCQPVTKKECQKRNINYPFYDPIPNDKVLNFKGGFTGDSDEKTHQYLGRNQQIIFGVHISTPLYFQYYKSWKERNPEYKLWTFQSYKNVLVTILLMEHEMTHALIGRYSTIMDLAPDLLEKEDLFIKGKQDMIRMYEYYLKKLKEEGKTLDNDNIKTYRPQKELGEGQFGETNLNQVNMNVPGQVANWYNVFTNTEGHNAFFGHLTYRRGLLGISVTTNALPRTKKARHLVLRFRITNLKPTENDLPRKKSSVGSSNNNNTADVDIVEDIYDFNIKLKF